MNINNSIVIGNFNVESDSKEMLSFCDTFDLASLIKEPTCYKNTNSPSCIDLILTSKPLSLKTQVQLRPKPRVINY